MTLVDLLENTAMHAADKSVIHVSRDGSESRQTYAQLHERAKQTLAFLQGHGVCPGRILVVQVGASGRQLEVFWACVLGGIIPVLLPKVASWLRDTEASRKLGGVCDTLEQPFILVDADQAVNYAKGVLNFVAKGIVAIADDPSQGLAGAARLHTPHPDELAYLQYSSGSTGLPKGVRLSHRNIVCNIVEIAQASAAHAEVTALSWMPYFHDMGLVGFHLTPLYLGMNQIKMEAAHFIADPLLWLRKIDQHRANMIGCPNFGLQHVLDKLGAADYGHLDLSCIRLLYNGAEPISAPVMQRFIAELAPTGFRNTAMLPVYGMAEACLAVTFSPLDAAPLVHQFDRNTLFTEGVAVPAQDQLPTLDYVDVGPPLPSVELRIVNERGELQPALRLGDIQIRGVSVTSGYQGLEDRNGELFTHDGWLRTGDVGFLKNARLIVTGRSKDVIFINGRNVMTADLERHLAQCFDLKEGELAACGVTHPDTGRECVVMFAASRSRNVPWARLHEMKLAAEEYLSFPVDSVLPMKQLPRTSSGKIQRYKLAQEWLNGALADARDAFLSNAPAATVMVTPADDRQDAIRRIWADVLQCDVASIGIDMSFTALGGTSVKAIEMLARLEERFGRIFGYALLLECRTVRDVGEFIAQHVAPHLSVVPETASPLPATAPGPRDEHMRIAVIGMSGRFPGAASLDAFWNNLRDGVSVVREVPPQRWHSDQGKFYMGMLADVDLFAADFFGIAGDEAAITDPQQRLMLEVAYEALDSAGYNGVRLDAERNVGVYLGVSHNSYFEEIVERRRDGAFAGSDNAKLMPANLLNMVAARVSHALNLKGPALTFDSACSSSLVALHQACNDLLLDNCDMAIAGGVNLMLTPTGHELFAQAGALSNDGVCRAFDEAANGMVPGEGLGAVVLKRLDRALADGDQIDAVIAATSINNDGRSIGIMAPTPEGQEAVLKKAYAKAGISPAAISYIEAHGTSTPIGDPIEMRALTSAFGAVAQVGTCGVGSVKTNIGHLLAAAGIAGLIKVILALRHQQLPPTLNVTRPQPRARFGETPFYLVSHLTPWPQGPAPRYAGISSFGFGGTNAHLVVRDHVQAVRSAQGAGSHHLLCLSARNPDELALMRADLRAHLRAHPDTPIADLCFTRSAGRQQFSARQALIVTDVADALAQLESQPYVPCETWFKKERAKIAFALRCGEADHAALIQAFYRNHTLFAQAFDSCIDTLRIVRSESSDGHALAEPASPDALKFAACYALARLWLGIGIKPTVLLAADRVGEHVAACLAGVFNLHDALALLLARKYKVQFNLPAMDVIFAGAPAFPASANELPAYWAARAESGMAGGSDRSPAPDVQFCVAIGGEALPHQALLTSLGALWQHGAAIDWHCLYRGSDARIANLPSYPMQRSSYWLPARSLRLPALVPQALAANAPVDWSAAGRPGADWFYRATWIETFLVDVTRGAPRRVLVLGADSATGVALCDDLEAAGCDVVRVDSALLPEGANSDAYQALFAGPEGARLTVCDARYGEIAQEHNMAEHAEAQLLGLLVLSQALMAQRVNIARFVIVTSGAMSVGSDDSAVSPTSAAVWSFARSLAQETSWLDVRCIDAGAGGDAAALLVDSVLSDQAAKVQQRFTALRGARRFIMAIEQAAAPAVPAATSFVSGGAYLIAGGLGGIGLAWSEWMAGRYRPTLILLARRLPDEHARERLARIRALGATVHLIQADIANPDDMARAEREIAAICTRLDGVLHAAGSLNDVLVQNMSADALRAVLASKVRGSVLLYRHTRSFTPGKFILFSSLVSVTGHAGQANHAAGNGFQDAFARWMAQQGQSSLVVNWGFWGEDGVVADPVYIALLARERVYPMSSAAALNAFAAACASGQERAIVANVGIGFFADFGLDQHLLTLVKSCERYQISAQLKQDLSRQSDLVRRFDQLCAILVGLALRRGGVLADGSPALSVDELCQRLGARADRRPQMKRMLDILQEEQWVSKETDRYRWSSNVLPDEATVQADIARLQQEFSFAANAILMVQRCMAALPEVLAGKLSPVAVLFDNGSITELEEFYSRFPVLALANTMAASTVSAIADSRHDSRLSILEVGSGTGALTGALLPALGERIGHYVYSDVSSSFLAHGQKKFGACAALHTMILDIDKDPAAQGLQEGSFDVVVAANVIHASPDLRRSIRHLRRTLREGGHLVLVETVAPNRFADCTVGLLDGWWSFRDADLRDGYPLLSMQQWQVLLREEGFEVAVVPVGNRGDAADTGTAIVIARNMNQSDAAPGAAHAALMMAPAAPVARAVTRLSSSMSAHECAATLLENELANQDLKVSDRDESLSMLGIDSLVTMQTGNALQSKLGIALPLSLFFEYDTVNLLAAYLVAEHGEALERYLSTEGATNEREHEHEHDLQSAAPAADYELSPAQRRLWFMAQLEPGNPFYNIPGAVQIDGPLDIAAFDSALKAIVAAQESLRTRFVDMNDEPRQVIDEAIEAGVRHVDLSALAPHEQRAALAQLRTDESEQAFDMSCAPLLRITLVRLSVTSHVFLYVLHHIIADGWSMGVFVRQMAHAYNVFHRGEAANPIQLPVFYKDYAVWQNRLIRDGAWDDQQRYWQARLAGELPVLQLPTDFPRPAMQSYRGAVARLDIDVQETDSLVQLAASHNVTMFMTLLSALYAVLHHLTQQSDVIVGSPIAGRNAASLEPLIGLFVNALALRADLGGNPTVSQLLHEVRQIATEAYANQDFPFDRVVEVVNPVRDLARSPIFSVMLIYQTAQMESNLSHIFDGVALEALPNDWLTSKFDLQFFIKQSATGLAISLEYSTDLFAEATAQRFLSYLHNTLRQMCASPGTRIGDLCLLSDAEQRHMLVDWNATAVSYPATPALHQLFEAQAARTPNAVAVVFGDAQLTYAELNAKANQLANHLAAAGVGPDVLVAICVERSLEMVIGLFAILKAGGAYVPLDPGYPKERLAYMLADAKPDMLLSQQHLKTLLPPSQTPVFYLDADWHTLAATSRANQPNRVHQHHLAYVIYTSGSTGKPKGVGIDHAGIVNRLLWMQETYGLTEADRVLQKTPFSFDVSVWEFFWPLATGARLIVAAPGGHQDPVYLSRLIEQQAITTLHFVPPMLDVFLDAVELERCRSLKRVLCSGQALPFDLQQRFFKQFQHVELHNLYGPTEASIDVTAWACERDSASNVVPIGRPIANTQMYILDQHFNPVPVGVAGQLHIAGIGLARGYLGRPDLTAEKFIPDPFSAVPGARMYCSGDLASYRDDGAITYIGRIDDQFKIRGFRIELAEVEGALCNLPGVATALADVRDDGQGEQVLVAYIVGRDADLPLAALRAALRDSLPEYMIPTRWMALPQLPLTPNGKIDRAALALPQIERAEFALPLTDCECRIALIWKDVLGIDTIGRHDNFFTLGGHSLLAVPVVSRTSKEMGVEIALRQLYITPTLSQFAEAVMNASAGGVAHVDDAELEGELSAHDNVTPTPVALPVAATARAAGRRRMGWRAGLDQLRLSLSFLIALVAGLIMTLCYLACKQVWPGGARWLRANLPRMIGQGILKGSGIRIVLEGRENLPDPDSAFVLMANHKSIFDGYLLLSSLPFVYKWFSADDNHLQRQKKLHIVQWMIEVCDLVFTHYKDDATKTFEEFQLAQKHLENGGRVLFSPEGGISKGDAIAKIGDACCRIVLNAAVPVVPIAILNSASLIDTQRNVYTPGTIVIRIGRPLYPEQLPDQVQLLSEHIRHVMQQLASSKRDGAAGLPLDGTRGG